uniref:Uncharacterized protein n=1 Tax=Wuchereria bancrofti TaxID=6293 RepID=A0A1I8ELB9_WUCBA
MCCGVCNSVYVSFLLKFVTKFTDKQIKIPTEIFIISQLIFDHIAKPLINLILSKKFVTLG